MKFTPSIKIFLEKEMETNKGNCIEISFSTSCCGKSININSSTQDNSKIKFFDDLPIVVSCEDEEMLEPIIFDYENDEITIERACTCGSC
ncbi:MAG: hypothetical protein WC162_07690 [Sphaerochaetaceae bacterium]|nr:hypothetical protein [Sphaerochaetaceae bacterium]